MKDKKRLFMVIGLGIILVIATIVATSLFNQEEEQSDETKTSQEVVNNILSKNSSIPSDSNADTLCEYNDGIITKIVDGRETPYDFCQFADGKMCELIAYENTNGGICTNYSSILESEKESQITEKTIADETTTQSSLDSETEYLTCPSSEFRAKTFSTSTQKEFESQTSVMFYGTDSSLELRFPEGQTGSFGGENDKNTSLKYSPPTISDGTDTDNSIMTTNGNISVTISDFGEMITGSFSATVSTDQGKSFAFDNCTFRVKNQV